MTVLDLNDCDLQEGGGQAIADVLRVNTTLTNLNLYWNELLKRIHLHSKSGPWPCVSGGGGAAHRNECRRIADVGP